MKREYIDVEQAGFTQAIAVEANGVRTVYISGQTSQAEDLKSQSIEVFANLEKRLKQAGAEAGDVVKLTTYIVDYTPDKIPDAFAGFGNLFSDRNHPPANTLLGVTSLFQPSILMEVEAIAVVDKS